MAACSSVSPSMMRGCISGLPSAVTGCAPGTVCQPPVGGAFSSGEGPAAAAGRALPGRRWLPAVACVPADAVVPFSVRPARGQGQRDAR